MAAIRTSLTSLLPGLRTPLVLGPMANAAGGALAGRVSRAGGLGFIGAGYYDADKLRSELSLALQILGFDGGRPPRGAGNRVHLGVGFLAWRLSAINKGKPPTLGASDMDVDSPALALIDAALKSKPVALWLSFGDDEEMIGWSTVVRQREQALNGMGKAVYGKDLKLFIGVGDETQAKAAVEDCGADVVVVQGNEAGGHGLGSSPPLSAVLPLITRRIGDMKPTNPSGTTPALLGAGGIMTGANLAATLAHGAEGAVLGTRLLLTPEADYSDVQKSMLLSAGPASTKRTMAFDEARGTLGWPQGVDGRGIVNDTVHDFEHNVGGDGDARRQAYKEAEKAGDTRRIVTWAGTGVGLVDEIKPTEDVIYEISSEAVDVLRRLSGFIDGATST